MWGILAATVGMAALVDRASNRLGQTYTVGDVTLRLPQGWLQVDASVQRVVLRERGDPMFARLLSVGFERSRSALDWILPAGDEELRVQTVELPDGRSAKLRVIERGNYEDASVVEVQASIPTSTGRRVVIALRQITTSDQADIEMNVRLVKRILQSVTFGSGE